MKKITKCVCKGCSERATQINKFVMPLCLEHYNIMKKTIDEDAKRMREQGIVRVDKKKGRE